jgi:hypothetical protein
MQDDVILDLEAETLVWCGETFRSRSVGLLRFIAFLAWEGAGREVGALALNRVLSSVAPRQIQRYIDKLEATGWAILAYQNKTVGPWRLVPRLSCVQGATAMRDWLLGKPVILPTANVSLSGFQSWVDQTYSYVHAEIDELDGNTPKCDLDSGNLDLLGSLMQARALILIDQLEVAQQLLDTVLNSSVVCDMAQPLKIQSKLLSARIAYNRSQFVLAERVLASVHVADLADLFNQGQYHNLQGLLHCHELKSLAWACSQDFDLPALNISHDQKEALSEQCHHAIAHFKHALSCWLASFSPQFVQAALFNIGNTLYAKARCGLGTVAGSDYQAAAAWLIECIRYCRKNFTGIETRLCEVTLIHLILDAKLQISDWPELWSMFSKEPPTLIWLAQAILKEAKVWAVPAEIERAKQLLNRIKHQS